MAEVGKRREKGARTLRMLRLRNGLSWKWAALAAVILAGAMSGRAQTPQTPQTAQTVQTTSSKHKVTLTFHYDFHATPPCTEKVRRGCVAQFIVYDLSAGYKHRTKLFTIPVGTVKGTGIQEITGTSPLILFETGKHLIGMSAQ